MQSGFRLGVRALTLLGLAGALACKGEPSAPQPPPPPPPAPPAPVALVTVTLAAPDLTIGQTAQATAVLKAANNQVLTGRATTWSSSDPAIASVSGAGLVSANAVGSADISATAEAITGSARIRVFGSNPNLALENVYLTQAVQRYAGGIPLVVGGNPVLVNVFGTLDHHYGAGLPTPMVRIEVFLGPTLLLTDEGPANGPLEPDVDQAFPLYRSVLPASIVQPGLRIRATINPDGVLPEPVRSDNSWPRSGPLLIAVQQVPPLPLHFVPIFLSVGGSTGNVSVGNLPEYLVATRQMHPVSTIAADVGAVFSSDVNFGGGTEAAWIAILQQLDLLRVLEGSASYYVGALRPPPGVNFVQFGGYGYIPSNPQSTGPTTRTAVLVGVGWFNRDRQTTELVAHELAHTMGRRHAPCGGAAAPDPAYPYPGGTIGVVGHDLFSWSQSGGGLPVSIDPNTADVMSYCVPAWISDYNYQALLGARGGPISTAATKSCDCLVVWGTVEGNTIRLEPSFVAPPPAQPSRPRPGPYSLEGSTASGVTLFRISFDAVEIDHAPGVRHFNFAIPLSAADRGALARLRVEGNGSAAERNVSAGPPGHPAVTAEPTGAGSLTLRWSRAEFPLLVARDQVTGRILGIARSGSLLLREASPRVEAILSDGVRSVMVRLPPGSGGVKK